MSIAYVDTSVLIAIAFGEPGGDALAGRLARYDVIASANLLEAELHSALRREGVAESAEEVLGGLSWILPDRRLTAEIERASTGRHLRGADLWHVASALYLAESPGEVDFLTLDSAQREVAASLGFPTPM